MANSPQVALQTFYQPTRALADAADGKRFVVPLLLLMVLAFSVNFILMPRFDFAKTISDQLDKTPAAAQMTPFQRDEAIATGAKLGKIAGYAGGVLAIPLIALFVSFSFWIGFRVAGGKPPFPATFAVTAHALLPGVIASLLSIPAILAHDHWTAETITRLLPSNLAAFLPAEAPVRTVALLSKFDVFTTWSLILVGLGMAHAAKVSRVRSFITTVVVWGAYVVVFGVFLPSLQPGGPK
jgi:hypothetical protein